MSEDRIDDDRGLPQSSEQASPEPDPPEDATERLERELAEERERAAALQATIDGLRFQLEVLEKSYSKQLADTRARAAAAEKRLEDQQARLKALGNSQEQTMRALAEARAELERMKSDPSRPRREPSAAAGANDAHALRHSSGDDTINELVADREWPKERRLGEDSWLGAHVRIDEEVPSEEMLPADLLFPGKKEDDAERS